MSQEYLSAVWSLTAPTANPYPPPSPHITLLHDLLLSRFSAHHLCILLPSVPSSYSRLLKALNSLYTWLINFTSHLSTILTTSGHQPPPLPPLSATPSEEASLSTAGLAAAITPFMAPEVAEVVNYMCSSGEGCHWASRLTPMVVASEVVISAMEKKGVGEMGGFFETVGRNVDMAGFMALMGEYVGLAGMVRKELEAVRASPNSGWREAEARDLAEGYLSRYRKCFVV